MMNKLLLFFSFVFLLSCERKPPYHYVIKNESGVDIEFIPYENSQPLVTKKVVLKNNSFIEKRLVPMAGSDVLLMNAVLFHHSINLTHIEIVFNNQKKYYTRIVILIIKTALIIQGVFFIMSIMVNIILFTPLLLRIIRMR